MIPNSNSIGLFGYTHHQREKRLKDIILPDIQKTIERDNYARYEIHPLDPNYGVIWGNSLRRTLLSTSLPGSAITSIRIDGVLHEFQDIEGVVEDVTEIVLNIKGLRLRCFTDHPVVMYLEVSGEKEVTAADISVPSTIEIVNPELHIATLDNDKARLIMQLTVELGRGYTLAQDNLDTIGVIPLDALFSPVKKVSYSVEQILIGDSMNHEKLILEITTDGTITPDDAIRQGADILVQHFMPIANFHFTPTENKELLRGELTAIEKAIYNTKIEALNLSVRTFNCLKRSGVTKVGEVLTLEENELMTLRNFGLKSLQELYEQLKTMRFLPDRVLR